MKDVENLHHKLVFLLDSDYDHKRSRRFVENLLKRRKEWLFNFVMDPHVEPTNNRAERALRSSVIYRKVSGGSRSERGAEIYTRIYSVYTDLGYTPPFGPVWDPIIIAADSAMK